MDAAFCPADADADDREAPADADAVSRARTRTWSGRASAGFPVTDGRPLKAGLLKTLKLEPPQLNVKTFETATAKVLRTFGGSAWQKNPDFDGRASASE